MVANGASPAEDVPATAEQDVVNAGGAQVGGDVAAGTLPDGDDALGTLLKSGQRLLNARALGLFYVERKQAGVFLDHDHFYRGGMLLRL